MLTWTKWHIGQTLLAVAVLTAVWLFMNWLFSKILKKAGIKDSGLWLLAHKPLIIAVNAAILWFAGIEFKEMLHFSRPGIGLAMTAAGLAFALLVAALTKKLIQTTDVGKKYSETLGGPKKSTRLFSLLAMSIFVGPSEDMFFLGTVQYVLTSLFAWLAVPAYLAVFTLIHTVNVLSGLESKQEFLGMLPVRLTISLILSLTFYLTGSILWSFIIHNLFDTVVFLGMLSGMDSSVPIPEQQNPDIKQPSITAR